MNWQLVTFYILGLVILYAAYRVVTSAVITHAALWLAVALVGVAGIYLQLQAEFLAIIQVLIYVGAIVTIIIFAIMLSPLREIKTEEKDRRGGATRMGRAVASVEWGLAPVAAGLLFALGMTWAYSRQAWPVGSVPPGLITEPLGKSLMTTYLLPFEVASVLLLVAMVGAIVLAIRGQK